MDGRDRNIARPFIGGYIFSRNLKTLLYNYKRRPQEVQNYQYNILVKKLQKNIFFRLMRGNVDAPFPVRFGFSILAATCSEFTTYPLDLAKTRLQVLKKIHKNKKHFKPIFRRK